MQLARFFFTLSAACSALPAQTATDEAALRKELARMYAHLDSAFERGRPGDALWIALPDATVRHGMEETRLTTMIGRAKQMLEAGARVKQNTLIMSLGVDETGARVRRRTESSVLMGGQTRSGIDRAEDIWVRTADGWRLKLSVALGSVERARPTTAETAALVVNEINAHAKPASDLGAISGAIGDARIVALGEATHGTREFSSTKARIVEHLATARGFTVLAVEDGWAEALAVDDYIKTGNGFPEEALASLKNWPNKTDEMLRLIRALRSINERTPGKITFAGFDMTSANRARELAAAFVRQNAPDRIEIVDGLYRQVIGLGPRGARSAPGAESAAEAARSVVGLFDTLRDPMVRASDHRRWRRARQAAEIVRQATFFRGETRAAGYRDEMMARNVEWLSEEHPGEKIVIWAHNGHVSASFDSASSKPMGAWLRDKYGNHYYAAGFAIGGGKVLAQGERGPAAYTMPTASGGSGDGVLAQAFLDNFFLNLRGLPSSSVLSKWLTEPHDFYSVGAEWNDAMPEANASVFSMSKAFDGLIFFRRGRAAIVR